MKILMALLLVLGSIVSYVVLATGYGIWQRVPWPHYLGALAGVAWLVMLVREKRHWARIGALVFAVLLTGLYAWWTLSFSAYEDRAHHAAPGETIPALATLELPDQDGKPARLLGEGVTLLVFYRGSWCPYCRQELIQLEKSRGEIERRGVRVVALSVDPPEKLALMQRSSKSNFLFVSDPSGKVLDLLDVRHAQGGDQGQDVAQSASFLIDGGGKVLWRNLAANYRERVPPAQIVAAIDALPRQAAEKAWEQPARLRAPVS